MAKIQKFPIEVKDVQVIELPKFTRLLSVSFEKGKIQLSAIVNAKEPTEERCIEVFALGKSMDQTIEREFIGNVYIGQQLCWYVFERTTSFL